MAEQSDFSAKFSTLNVNAMEFVPNFGGATQSSPPAASTTAQPEKINPSASNEAETASSSPPRSPTPPEESSPVKGESASLPATVATPTEPLTDKSPDNPGEFQPSMALGQVF